MTTSEVGWETEVQQAAYQYRVSREANAAMEHNEAVEMMASEKYLLDELSPELRDAYEDHFFGCAECAQDVQLGAAFIDQTKIVLPQMKWSSTSAKAAAVRPVQQKREWFAWLRPAWLQPALLVPAFACLLAIVGYQNLVVYPAMRAAAMEPRILPSATVLHDDTRSGIPVIYADLKLGTTITVEMPAGATYSSYKLDFYDADGKFIWTRPVPSDNKGDDMLTFWLSSAVKLKTYKLIVSGVTPTGEVVQIKQQMFDLQVKK